MKTQGPLFRNQSEDSSSSNVLKQAGAPSKLVTTQLGEASDEKGKELG